MADFGPFALSTPTFFFPLVQSRVLHNPKFSKLSNVETGIRTYTGVKRLFVINRYISYIHNLAASPFPVTYFTT